MDEPGSIYHDPRDFYVIQTGLVLDNPSGGIPIYLMYNPAEAEEEGSQGIAILTQDQLTEATLDDISLFFRSDPALQRLKRLAEDGWLKVIYDAQRKVQVIYDDYGIVF